MKSKKADLNSIIREEKKIEKESREMLNSEKEILNEILEEEMKIKDQQDAIKREEIKIEQKESEIEQLIKSRVVTRKYTDIIDWKTAIWENCTHKVELKSDKEVNYMCKKLGKPCNFTACPLNFY